MFCAGLFSAVFITISLRLDGAVDAFTLQRGGILRRQGEVMFSEHSTAAALWCRGLDLTRMVVQCWCKNTYVPKCSRRLSPET